MRITFVLPQFQKRPTGGLRIAYEYVNRLAARGHAVSALHLAARPASGAGAARRRASFALWRRGWRAQLRIDPRVHAALVDPSAPAAVPDGDAIVAVGWQSVEFVSRVPASAGMPRYLAQGYMEGIEGNPGDVDAAWRRPMPKIVVSGWLLDKARELCGPDAEVELVPNGIDTKRFTIRVDPRDRPSASVAMLFHGAAYKGALEGVAALERVRQARPDLHAVLFGVDARPSNLPSWIEYVHLPPDVVQVYNSCAIFLHTSHTESWPLAPAEAMACGCAVVAAANRGIAEYAQDGVNALLVPVGDVAAMADAIGRLIGDDQLRLRVAAAGRAGIAAYDWESSVTMLERVLAGPGGARQPVDDR